MACQGNGSGDGIQADGGNAVGGATAGSGLRIRGGTASTTAGGEAGHGLFAFGGTGASSANISGRGMTVVAGTDGGFGGNAGARFQAGGPDSESGIVSAGTGTGAGFIATGGPTNGHGIRSEEHTSELQSH